MIFNNLKRVLETRKGIPFTLIIDNELIKLPDSRDNTQVMYLDSELLFGKMVSSSQSFNRYEFMELTVKDKLTEGMLGDIDLRAFANVNDYKIEINSELKILFITTAPLNQLLLKMRQFRGSEDVNIILENQSIKSYTANEFTTLYYNVVSELYERYRETGLNYLVSRLLRSPELIHKPVGSLVKLKHGFVPVFIHVDGLYQPLDFDLIMNRLKDKLIYLVTKEIGVRIQIGNMSMYFLTHKEVCKSFSLFNYVQFNTLLIQDLIYSVLLNGTKSEYKMDGNWCYLLDSKSSSPDNPTITYEPSEDRVQVSEFALRLLKNKKYSSDIYNTLLLVENFKL